MSRKMSGRASGGGRSAAAERRAEAAAAAEAAAEVGRLVDSSQADDRRMIRLVRARQLLYARNNMPVASYYSQVKKLWQEVADDMGWTVADVRRKWSHIRNSYSRHLRNEMHGVRTGRGRMVSKWYLADELGFLREHMATDTRPSPYSYDAPIYLENTKAPKQPAAAEALGEVAGGVDLKPFLAPWFSLAQAAPTPGLEPQVRLDESSSPLSFEPDENQAYFQFFRSIYPDYRKLPLRKQRLFRRECLNLMHRLLDEEEDEEGAPGGGGEEAVNLSAHSDEEQVYVKHEPEFVEEDVDLYRPASPGNVLS